MGQIQAPPLRYLSWPTALLRCHHAGGSPGVWLKCGSSFRSCISDKLPGDADAEDCTQKKQGILNNFKRNENRMSSSDIILS